MGLKRIFGLVCIAIAFSGCGEDAASQAAKEVRCDGASIPFPSQEETRAATRLYLRSYSPSQIATLQPVVNRTHLCLIDCNLTSLDPQLLSPSLEQLWLSDNQLRTLPSALTNTSLTYLNLDRNLLRELPDLRRLPLRWLRLNENQLSSWPLMPDTVERLYLAHNRLTQIPSKPAQLKEAELSYNPITQLPNDFGIGMTRLDVAYTQLKTLPNDLSQWQTLRFINLAGCPMSNEEKDRIQRSFDKSTTIIF